MDTRVLVVDDEKLIRMGIAQALETAGHLVEQAATAGDALAAVEKDPPDLVLLDYKLPDRTGIEVLADIRKVAPHVPVIMITAHASVPGAVEAVKQGVYDYLAKPFEVPKLLHTVTCALEASRLREVVAWQRGKEQRGSTSADIVAESPAMKRVVHILRRVAGSEAPTVLLLGESGVGKGLLARALHNEGSAAGEAFMNISCTSLPEQLLESELFGHEKGAFTDAKSQKKGLIELAHRGTVFLDEIGDISMGLQAKLLGFLEDRVFRRIGGVRDIDVRVRVIAATNKDLEKEVEAGRFRSDLYYRLKVIPVTIPPLRDRREDLPALTEMFIRHFSAEFGKAVTGVDKEAAEAIAAYGWPGNVRELRNALERAVLLGDGDTLTLWDLPPEISETEVAPASSNGNGVLELPSEGLVLESLERDLVCQALRRTRGNRARAARLLGMNRDQMRYRIKKFELVEFLDQES
jgi:DNA-binding NtrC family response regulator